MFGLWKTLILNGFGSVDFESQRRATPFGRRASATLRICKALVFIFLFSIILLLLKIRVSFCVFIELISGCELRFDVIVVCCYRLKKSLLRSRMCNLWTVQWLFVVIFMGSFMILWNFSRREVMSRRPITFLWYVALFYCWCVFCGVYCYEWMLWMKELFGVWQGDFVDRGYNSLEVFTILLLLKARYAWLIYLGKLYWLIYLIQHWWNYVFL